MDIARDMDPPVRSCSTWIERTAVFPVFVRVTGHPYITAFSTNLRTALQPLDIPFGSTIRDKQSAVSGQAPITVFTAVESGNTMEIMGARQRLCKFAAGFHPGRHGAVHILLDGVQRKAAAEQVQKVML